MILLLSSVSFAYESEPQDVLVLDAVDVFGGAALDTDWWPADSPLQVRFQVETTGGADLAMDGTADVWWPLDMNLAITGETQTGELVVDAILTTVTSIKFDVGGYAWEAEVDRRDLELDGEGSFDPFLLPGTAVTRVEVDFAGLASELVEYSYAVYTGVDVVFTMDVTPSGTVAVEGLRFEAGDAVIEEEGASSVVTATGGATLDLDLVWWGLWESGLDLTLTPAFEVCVAVVGCTELGSFDYTFTAAADAWEEDADPAPLSFPIPNIDVDDGAYDFGSVEVGTTSALELEIASAGAMDLEGEALLLGSTYYRVFPGTFGGPPGASDGVVVTFAPETEGPFEGTLVLASNDPAVPSVEIALTGEGVVLGDDASDGDEVHGQARVCGCHGGAAGGRFEWHLALVAAAIVLARTFARRLRRA